MRGTVALVSAPPSGVGEGVIRGTKVAVGLRAAGEGVVAADGTGELVAEGSGVGTVVPEHPVITSIASRIEIRGSFFDLIAVPPRSLFWAVRCSITGPN